MKFFYLIFALMLAQALVFAEKSAADFVGDYLKAENPGELRRFLAYEPMSDGQGLRERKENEIAELLFLTLDKLSEAPKPFCPQTKLKAEQIIDLIVKSVEASKFRNRELSNTNLDDKDVKILFKALRANLPIEEPCKLALVRYLEKATETEENYLKLFAARFTSESERLALIDSWEKSYFESKKTYPVLLAMPKYVSSYEMFLKCVKNFELSYDGGICLDGGSVPIKFTNGVRTYTVYLQQSLFGKYKESPVTIKIESNSDGYYTGEILEFSALRKPSDFACEEFNDERFFDALKGKSLSKESADNLGKIAADSKDENVKKQIARLLKALNCAAD